MASLDRMVARAAENPLEENVVRVTVEGYVRDQLTGGVLLEHRPPSLMPFPGHDVFLPLDERRAS